MSIDITALFVCLDDFSKLYEASLKAQALSNTNKRQRSGYLSLGEMLFIEVFYHFSPYKDFKHYYLYGICHEHRDKFGKLPCYQRFVSLKKQLFMPMSILLHSLMGEKTGIYFMAVKITPGNIDDRKALAEIVNGLQGKCYHETIPHAIS